MMTIIFSNTLGQIAWADYPYIDDFSAEAKGLVNTPVDAGQVRQIEGYTDRPKESNYRADELKKKAQDKQLAAKANTSKKGISDAQRMEAESIQGFKEGRYSNEYRSVYTASKLQNKDFIKKSDNITENPIGIVNTLGQAECAVTAADAHKEEVQLEEYEVEVLETVLKEQEYQCEEDADQLFYCEKKLKAGGCLHKTYCAFEGNQGGLFNLEENKQLVEVSNGIGWHYDSATTTLHLSSPKSYAYDVGRHGCAMKEFTARFYIQDLKNVSVFKLKRVFENNILHIEVNGKVIYNGLGGNALWLGGGSGYNQRVHGGNGRESHCGLNAGHTHWKDHEYDILANDILMQGANELKILLAYHWYGHAGVQLEAKQYCCQEWGGDAWESDCPVQ